MTRYPESKMWEICQNNIENVNGKTAFDAMRCGDKAGIDVVNKYIEYVAIGVANNINIFQPEVLCIGGGISKEGDSFWHEREFNDKLCPSKTASVQRVFRPFRNNRQQQDWRIYTCSE
jgi:predicted NBD/HSP70 family sugar kinase